MAAISSKLRNWRDPATGNEGLSYWCQGCNGPHTIRTKGPTAWKWDGNAEAPTFEPSVLVTAGHYVTGQPQPPDCHYCKHAAEDGHETFCGRCHTFIRGGMVQFLGDCTHKLAGQTLPLPDWPEGWGT